MKQGFTLIELLAVIVIIAIIALISGFAMGKIMDYVKISALEKTALNAKKAANTLAVDANNNSDNYYEFDLTPADLNAEVNSFAYTGGYYKNSLDLKLDPWGKPYQSVRAEVINKPNSSPIINVYIKVANGCYILYDGQDKLNKDTSCGGLANRPLLKGLIPVVFDDPSDTWQVADIYGNETWYNYGNKKWANAVLIKQSEKNKYYDKTYKVGTTINNNDVIGYFVWIPRYSYTIYRGTNSTENYFAGGSKDMPGSIDIKFISTTTKETGSLTNNNGIPVGAPYYKNNIKSNPSNWLTPSGFTFGGKELSGLWVGKFKTSGDFNAPLILPGGSELNSATYKTMFETAIQLNNESYNMGNQDAHMMKNNEWSTIAYLSQSEKGRCTDNINCPEVRHNQTRISGGANYMVSTNYSTTNNITGIYDMSGYGEALMAKFNGQSGSSGFAENNLPEDKYYDLYTSDNYLTACNGGVCYGHTTIETIDPNDLSSPYTGWYNDLNRSVNAISPWIVRGSEYNFTSDTGIFNYANHDGSAHNYIGFRIVLTPN